MIKKKYMYRIYNKEKRKRYNKKYNILYIKIYFTAKRKRNLK